MKKLLPLLILGLFSFNITCAQSSVWKIDGKGSTIYIGGTVHLLRDRDYPLPDEFDHAFGASEILVLETQLPEPADKSFVQKLIGLTLYPNNKSLKTVLSDEVYKELEDACKENGILLDRMIGLKPSMVILTLSRLELQKIGVTAVGVDRHYSNKATQNNKQIFYLETIDEQLNLIANMGDRNENDFVKYSLRDLKESTEDFNELIDTWKKGTAKPMFKQLKEFKRDYPELYKSLMVERNNNWIPQIEDYFKTTETEFVLFGALHLHGPDGILQQLKKRGYKVNQLKIRE